MLEMQCKKCEQKQKLKNIIHKKEFCLENGRKVFLTLFECKKCKKINFVQLDDEYTIEVLKEAINLFIKMSEQKKRNKKIAEKEILKFNEKRNHLNNCRAYLLKYYVGRTIIDNETKKKYVLDFTTI